MHAVVASLDGDRAGDVQIDCFRLGRLAVVVIVGAVVDANAVGDAVVGRVRVGRRDEAERVGHGEGGVEGRGRGEGAARVVGVVEDPWGRHAAGVGWWRGCGWCGDVEGRWGVGWILGSSGGGGVGDGCDGGGVEVLEEFGGWDSHGR